MKHILTPLLLSLALSLAGLTTSAQAQSFEEFDALMQQIRERMQDLEQSLAEAARPATSVGDMFEEFSESLQSDDGSAPVLPSALREFLMSHPELLAEAMDPTADPDTMLDNEDRIRARIYSSEDGLEQLLAENPELIQGLLADPERLEAMLADFFATEDDLTRLFQTTEREMVETEEDIDRLLEMAAAMQQSGAGSPSGEQQPQPGEGEQPGEEGDPNSPQEGNPNQAENEYTPPPGSESGEQREGEQDLDAWTQGLPEREQEAARQARAGQRPPGYEEELSQFYRSLAELSRRMREARESSQGEQPEPTPPAEDSGN